MAEDAQRLGALFAPSARPEGTRQKSRKVDSRKISRSGGCQSDLGGFFVASHRDHLPQ
jgi:hypothetical protein